MFINNINRGKLWDYLCGQNPKLKVISAERFQELYTARSSFLYQEFAISKKNGKKRIIQNPCPDLKLVQKHLNAIFYQFPFQNCIFGLKGTNALQNAEVHLGQKVVLKMDIADFFSSTQETHYITAIEREKHLRGINEELYQLLLAAKDLVFYKKNDKCQLPTGAPSSPVVSSICFSPMDEALNNMAIADGLNYTRYIDDLTFSGPEYPKGFQMRVCAAARMYGYKVNHEKSTLLYQSNDPQVITGVSGNVKLNAPPQYRKQLRAELDHHARIASELSPELEGKLAYVSGINDRTGNKMRNFFQRRVRYYQNA